MSTETELEELRQRIEGFDWDQFETLFMEIAQIGHDISKVKGFWEEGIEERNKGELFMLMVTELAEAFEGVRKPGQSDKIPEYTIIEEEVADEFVRLGDSTAAFGWNVIKAWKAKLFYNLMRPYKHGKTC